MFGTSYFSNIATQNNSLTADIRISWPSSSQLDSELGSSSVPVDPMATGTGSTSPRIAAMADPVIGDVVPPTGLDMPIPVTPQELLTPQKFVLSPGANDPDDVKMAKLEAKIKELEAVISSFNSWIPALVAGQQKPKEFSPEKIENEDDAPQGHEAAPRVLWEAGRFPVMARELLCHAALQDDKVAQGH